jgi:hypothetical protein
MSPEIALYERELCWLLEHMRVNVDALTERQLHWHPALATTRRPGRAPGASAGTLGWDGGRARNHSARGFHHQYQARGPPSR